MKIAHILVCHSVDPTKCFNSIPQMPGDIWYTFLHSDNANVAKIAASEMRTRDGNLFDYKSNRGIAKSWNEGMHLALESGCNAVLLLNDDLYFLSSGYDLFRTYIDETIRNKNDVAFITLHGMEVGRSEYAGQVHQQGFACCAIPRSTVECIGYFDEMFCPAYFEDADFSKRTMLAGLNVHVDERCLCEHERSSTISLASAEQQNKWHIDRVRSAEYYSRKWGGIYPSTFDRPFNDPKATLKIDFKERARVR